MATYKPKKKIDKNGTLEEVKIPIESVDGLDSKLNKTEKLIQDLDEKVAEELADKIGIEDVEYLDMYMGMVEPPQTDDGVYWSENAEFRDKYGATLKTVESFHHIPISSGEGIKFERDEETVQVKISTDLPTVQAGLKDASEVGIAKISYVDETYGDPVVGVDSFGVNISVESEIGYEVGDSVDYSYPTITSKIPIVAGENIEFENDTINNVVKINSTVEVPTKTSQLTNDSGFTTDTKLNNFKNEYNAHKHTVTPSGSVSSTFSGDSLTSTGTYKPSGEVSSTFAGTTMTSTGTFTPEGTISTVSHKPSGSVTVSATTSATGNYTPVGSVSKPTISVSPSFSTVLASGAIIGTFADGGLTLSLSTTTDNVVKSATASLDSTPTFTGTKVNISASFSGDSFSVTPTFTGTSGSVSVSGTTAGSVGSTFSGTSANISVSGTPSGTITSEFEGTSLQTTSTPV